MIDDTAAPSPMETYPAPKTTVLKITVIVMAVLLIAGFALVVTTIAKRLAHPETSRDMSTFAGRFGVSDIHIEPGEKVRSISMTEDRLAIHVGSDKSETIIIVDVRTGQEMGRIQLHPLTDLAQQSSNP